MCGIIGIINFSKKPMDAKFVLEAWKRIEHRGNDYFKIWVDGEKIVGDSIEDCIAQIPENFKVLLAQNTLSITGEPGFPKEMDGKVLVANAEVFNWKELGEYESDLEVFFHHELDRINGIFACGLLEENILTLFRDVIGVNPLCYYKNDSFFMFASEGKALPDGFLHLNPQEILRLDITSGKVWFENSPQRVVWFPETWHRDYVLLENKLVDAIEVQTRDLDRFGIMFSGGVDSSFLAKVCQDLERDFICYSFGLENSEDIVWAERVADEFSFELNIITLDDIYEFEDVLRTLIYVIEDNDVMKLSVAIPFYYVGATSKNDGNKVMFSGLGSEELFGGYERHKGDTLEEIHRNCVDGLKSMWLRDLYRDNCTLMYNTQELRVPFLDLNVVNTALSFDPKYRIYQGHKKYVFRKIAEKYLGSSAWRPKKAAQYGSGVMKVLKKLARKEGFKYVKKYISHLNTSCSNRDTI